MFRQAMTAAIVGALTGAVWQPAAAAGEQTLEFRLVVMPVEAKTLEAPSVAGQAVSLMKMHGVAFFKDGRVAAKDFIFNTDFNRGSGPFFGYSTYQFEDGSTITARFAGTQRAGQPMHGDYTIESGTGVFAGAKGTGAFDSAPHKLTGANLFNGRLSITMP